MRVLHAHSASCREKHSSMLVKAAILAAKATFAKTSTAKGGTTR
jgi:hypothetical protein